MARKINIMVRQGKILALSDYGMKEFWKALPGREWSKAERAWVFPATPVAAVTLLSGMRKLEYEYDADDEFYDLITQWTDFDTVRESGEYPQPRTINTPMWDHQKEGVAWAMAYPSIVFHAGMGTGKSAMFVALCGDMDLSRVLIVAPKKPMGIWPKQFRTHSKLDWDVLVLNSGKSVEARANQGREFLRVNEYHDKRSVVVVNYDAFWRPAMAGFIHEAGFEMVGYDEVHRIKSNSSQSSKFADKLYAHIGRRIGMTGTMMAHSPLDSFGQLRAIEPGVFGRSYPSFRNRYAVMGGFNGNQVLAFKNKAEMKSRIDMVTLYVDRDKVLDLPEEIDVDMPVELSAKALALHQQMERQFYLEVDSGEVVASNAISKLMKLAQIANGFVIDGNNEPNELGDDKKQALKDIAQDAELPLVVFCRFRNDLAQVEAVAKELGLTYHECSGSRHELNEDETIMDDTQILGVQIQSGSEGVDFTKASVAVFFSFGFSLKDWKQSRARLHRPGQKKPVTFIKLVANRTVDVKIYKAIEKNEQIVDAILNNRDLCSKYDDN